MLDLDINWVIGTDADDNVTGTNGMDVFFGWGGNDKFVGWNGNDIAFGMWGDDNLIGGRGNDWLFGGSGDDRLSGGLDNDCLFGGCGDDLLVDYAGNNYLSGGWGDDTLIVGHGTNWMRGGCGADEFAITNKWAINVPDQPVAINDMHHNVMIKDFNGCKDVIGINLGKDTDNDGVRDVFLDSVDDLTLSFNEYGWAVFSNEDHGLELTLAWTTQAHLDYYESKGMDIFDFTIC